MSDLLGFCDKEREEEKIAAIIEKYGMGFDDVYRDGKYEGKIEGKREGERKAKRETALNFLAEGIDEDIISKCTGISISEINNFKRE